MNKKEKKAIEDMNRFANGVDMSCVTARQMQIILNLIEKLQKENEEKTTILLAGAEKVKQLEKENSDEQGYLGNINPDVIYGQIEILEEILKLESE